jgi:hypothetical protein
MRDGASAELPPAGERYLRHHPALTGSPPLSGAHARTDQEQTAPMTMSPPQAPQWFDDRTRTLAADDRAVTG